MTEDLSSEQVLAGVVTMRTYFATMWEATRQLIADFQEQTGEHPDLVIPPWDDLPPLVQAAVGNRGMAFTDEWDRLVITTAEHHQTGGHS